MRVLSNMTFILTEVRTLDRTSGRNCKHPVITLLSGVRHDRPSLRVIRQAASGCGSARSPEKPGHLRRVAPRRNVFGDVRLLRNIGASQNHRLLPPNVDPTMGWNWRAGLKPNRAGGRNMPMSSNLDPVREEPRPKMDAGFLAKTTGCGISTQLAQKEVRGHARGPWLGQPLTRRGHERLVLWRGGCFLLAMASGGALSPR